MHAVNADAQTGSRPVSRDDLVRLSKLRPSRWARDLILDWALIAVGIAIYGAIDSLWALPFVALFVGSRQHALALLGHDATHRSALPNRRWNDLLGEVLTAWPLFVIIDHGYRPWHFQHHRSLGTESDPELVYRKLRPYTLPVTRQKIALWFGLDMIGLGIPDLIRFQRAVFPDRPWRHWGPLAWYAVFASLTIWLDCFWVFGVWTWSLLTAFWAIFRFRTWYEHVGLEQAGQEGTHRFSANPVVRFLFFPHNTHCHYEHHRWPSVPYYNLPALRDLVKERPVLTSNEVFVRFEQCDGRVGEAQLRIG